MGGSFLWWYLRALACRSGVQNRDWAYKGRADLADLIVPCVSYVDEKKVDINSWYRVQSTYSSGLTDILEPCVLFYIENSCFYSVPDITLLANLSISRNTDRTYQVYGVSKA